MFLPRLAFQLQPTLKLSPLLKIPEPFGYLYLALPNKRLFGPDAPPNHAVSNVTKVSLEVSGVHREAKSPPTHAPALAIPEAHGSVVIFA